MDVPTLDRPVSQACTQSQIESDTFKYWCARLGLAPVPHRKIWEWCYILQALSMRGMLSPGRKGVGFGVGTEPLTDLFASYNIEITATDQAAEDAAGHGWGDSNQHALHRTALRKSYASDAQFERVRFEVVDMNAIPATLRGFDFTWSACSLEHLGSIERGLRFVEESLRTLCPGGVAVHTTELNCSSDEDTIDNDWCVLYRRRDLAAFADHLSRQGHSIHLNFFAGDLPNDHFVDLPPYHLPGNPHLKMKLGAYATTSFGLLIQKAPAIT
jgi:hypothetical protein